MKIKITTDRLPHKYPKGDVYKEETEILMKLVKQGEAEIVKESKIKKVIKKVIKKK